MESKSKWPFEFGYFHLAKWFEIHPNCCLDEQMGNFKSEVETIGKNQMERLNIEDTVAEMKNAFNGLVSPSAEPFSA